MTKINLELAEKIHDAVDISMEPECPVVKMFNDMDIKEIRTVESETLILLDKVTGK